MSIFGSLWFDVYDGKFLLYTVVVFNESRGCLFRQNLKNYPRWLPVELGVVDLDACIFDVVG